MFEGLKRRLEQALDRLEGRNAPRAEEEIDRLLAGMREELIDARARFRKQAEEVADYERRLEALRERDDVDPGQLEELEREVARRRAEVEEHRAVVDELSERFREAARGRDAMAARERRSRASEEVRQAGEEEIRDFERLEERVEDDARRVDADREVEEALDGGSRGEGEPDLEETFRDARADEQLRELKRRMGIDPDEGN